MRALGSFQLASTANRVIQATKANAGNPWMQKGIPVWLPTGVTRPPSPTAAGRSMQSRN